MQLGSDRMLDAYIYDYFIRKQLYASAKTFQAEGNVSIDLDILNVDAPGGFLSKWWSVFWDIYTTRVGHKYREEAASYSKSQEITSQLRHNQQEQELQNTNQNHQKLMQHLLQGNTQHQHLSATQPISGSPCCPISNDPLMRQSQATFNAMETITYEDRLRLPLQRDGLDDASIKQKVGDVCQLLNPNHALLEASTITTTGEQGTLLNVPSILQGNIIHAQNLNQKLPGSTQDIKSNMNTMMRSQAVVPEGSFLGCHGSNEGVSNLTLEGWPLAGLEELRSGFVQQKNIMQSPQSFSLRQQVMLEAQQNLICPSANDFESTNLRMVYNNQNMGLLKDGTSNMFHKVSKSKTGPKRKASSSSCSGAAPANNTKISGTVNTTGPLMTSPSTQTPPHIMPLSTLPHNLWY